MTIVEDGLKLVKFLQYNGGIKNPSEDFLELEKIVLVNVI